MYARYYFNDEWLSRLWCTERNTVEGSWGKEGKRVLGVYTLGVIIWSGCLDLLVEIEG